MLILTLFSFISLQKSNICVNFHLNEFILCACFQPKITLIHSNFVQCKEPVRFAKFPENLSRLSYQFAVVVVVFAQNENAWFAVYETAVYENVCFHRTRVAIGTIALQTHSDANKTHPRESFGRKTDGAPQRAFLAKDTRRRSAFSH